MLWLIVSSSALLAPSAMRLASPVKVASSVATSVQRVPAPSLMLREMVGRPTYGGYGRWGAMDRYGTGWGPYRNGGYGGYGGYVGYGGYGMGGYGGYGGYGMGYGRYGGMGG